MALMNTYGNRTTTLVKGKGPYVWDTEGSRYLDALSGIAVCGLGHAHPAVTHAISEQASELLHVSNLYNIQPQIQLADLLCELSGMDSIFFSNSGAEANEAAIKIARKYGLQKGLSTPHIISAHNSFHGRTLATLSATGSEKAKKGFTPLLDGFTQVEYNSINAILEAATDQTIAIMVEPIQGEGGIRLPSADFLPELRALCDERDWLLILDEIQTGNGRTGRYYAFQHHDLKPDVMTTAKGLANGVPIGACFARGKAASVLEPGNHGTTFGGNPLACRAALAVLHTLIDEKLLQRVQVLGNHILQQLQQKIGHHPLVKDIRGKGLMIGIELKEPCGELVEKAKALGILLNVTAGNTIRLLPPFILTDEQADEICLTVAQLVQDFAAPAGESA